MYVKVNMIFFLLTMICILKVSSLQFSIVLFDLDLEGKNTKTLL